MRVYVISVSKRTLNRSHFSLICSIVTTECHPFLRAWPLMSQPNFWNSACSGSRRSYEHSFHHLRPLTLHYRLGVSCLALSILSEEVSLHLSSCSLPSLLLSVHPYLQLCTERHPEPEPCLAESQTLRRNAINFSPIFFNLSDLGVFECCWLDL